MAFLVFIIIIVAIPISVIVILSLISKPRGAGYQPHAQTTFNQGSTSLNQVPVSTEPRYFYSRKPAIMTPAETDFYKRLARITAGKYIVFPQIHLSALLKNETKGTYWKAAFQRINRTSVDYVLADAQTLRAIYAVELDDWSHDSLKRRERDAGVEQMLADAGIPLVRFRDVRAMSDEQVVAKFVESGDK